MGLLKPVAAEWGTRFQGIFLKIGISVLICCQLLIYLENEIRVSIQTKQDGRDWGWKTLECTWAVFFLQKNWVSTFLPNDWFNIIYCTMWRLCALCKISKSDIHILYDVNIPVRMQRESWCLPLSETWWWRQSGWAVDPSGSLLPTPPSEPLAFHTP